MRKKVFSNIGYNSRIGIGWMQKYPVEYFIENYSITVTEV